jgi:hypothetical protein
MEKRIHESAKLKKTFSENRRNYGGIAWIE